MEPDGTSPDPPVSQTPQEDDSQLVMRLDYHVGKGGLWGPYDFWMGVIESLTAGVVLVPLGIAVSMLANKIYETLSSSKAEKDDTQSCRFDLLIPAKNNSWIVVRVMRSAKFRTNALISEQDIQQAIISAAKSFSEALKDDPGRTYLVTAELANSGNTVTLHIDLRSNIDVSALPGLKSQIDTANSGTPIIIKYK